MLEPGIRGEVGYRGSVTIFVSHGTTGCHANLYTEEISCKRKHLYTFSKNSLKTLPLLPQMSKLTSTAFGRKVSVLTI